MVLRYISKISSLLYCSSSLSAMYISRTLRLKEISFISPDRTEIDVVLTGSGVQSYDLYINNQFYKTVKVDFDAND